MLDIRNYCGDFKLFPNVQTICEMVEVYKHDAPIAYTLDVGVDKTGSTFVIECHDFFSVGLYGFNDNNKLPYMFLRWYQQYLTTNNILYQLI